MRTPHLILTLAVWIFGSPKLAVAFDIASVQVTGIFDETVLYPTGDVNSGKSVEGAGHVLVGDVHSTEFGLEVRDGELLVHSMISDARSSIYNGDMRFGFVDPAQQVLDITAFQDPGFGYVTFPYEIITGVEGVRIRWSGLTRIRTLLLTINYELSFYAAAGNLLDNEGKLLANNTDQFLNALDGGVLRMSDGTLNRWAYDINPEIVVVPAPSVMVVSSIGILLGCRRQRV